MSYLYKQATESWEMEQIFKLNCQTFCQEIPQHPPPPDQRLVDRFHQQNTYFVCLCRSEVAGMLCLRDKRPFSLDQKLKNLDDYLPPECSPVEVRLLSVQQGHRKGLILKGLFEKASSFCKERGYDIALISGFTEQLPLYQKLGFIPFGPPTGIPPAQFQPMYLTWDHYRWN